MKTPIRIRSNITPKQSPKQGQTNAEIGQCGRFLGFTPMQMLAIELIAKTESKTINQYLRQAILCILDTSIEDLDHLAERRNPFWRPANSVLKIALPEVLPLLKERYVGMPACLATLEAMGSRYK